MGGYIWTPPSPWVKDFSRAVFGSLYALPVLSGIGRLRDDGVEVFSYYDVVAAASVQYPDVRNRLSALRKAGLVEVVDDEYVIYMRATDCGLWAAARRLLAEVEQSASPVTEAERLLAGEDGAE